MHKWLKGIASWKCGRTLYLSVPFTWLLDEARTMAEEHNGPVVAGGPAVQLMGAPWADTPDSVPFDVLAMHNPCAMFTTRGCPNHCSFCAVPQIEGGLRELPSWKPAPVVCDNNLLAASKAHFVRVIDSLLPFSASDFNQGLDARLFTSWHAGQIARLHSPMVRFAFDHVKTESSVADAIRTARAAGLKRFGVYVLFGFKDTIDDAHYRLEKVRSWGIRPNPMRYQPLYATEKNAYVAPQWNKFELMKTARYYSRLRWLEHIAYADYDPSAIDEAGQMRMF
jgi:hypothetical protein